MPAADLAGLVRDAVLPHVGPALTPGLVALVACGDDVHVEVLGELSIGGPPVRRDSLFRIASISKPITAVAALTLVDRGLFALDDPVGDLLPELENPRVLARIDGPLDETVAATRAITVRDLLNFTFGFGSVMELFMAASPWPIVTAENDLGLASLGPPQPDLPPEPDVWIASLGTLPLMAQPGERWFYNTGAQVLGVLIARAAGKPFPDVLKENVFGPLAMTDTGFFTTEPERLATSYRNTPEGLVVFDQPEGRWSRPQPFPDGAAGLLSTVDDLHAFSRMLLSGGGSVLSPESVLAMSTGQLSPEQRRHSTGFRPGFFSEHSWGFCQAVYGDGSCGWDGGLGTSWRIDPGRELVVICFTQRMFDSPDPPLVHKDVLAAAYAAAAG